MSVNRPWTAEDDAALRLGYDSTPAVVLAAQLGRARSAMYKRAEKLGLVKTRILRTPGKRPHNYAPVGTIRTQGRQRYLVIKISEGAWPDAWKLLHYVNWEAVHGPVPDTHVLAFRDGKVAHVEVENLELVAKKDWILRYHPETTLPPELANIIRLKAVLSRHINKRNKENEQQ